MTDTRVLTIRQPYAWAIAHSGKTPENRARNTRFRGRLFIHAGGAWSEHGQHDPVVRAAWAETPRGADGEPLVPGDAELPRFGVIAVCELVGAHRDDLCCRPWGMSYRHDGDGDVWHWELANVRALVRPVRCRGRLGLWRPPEGLLGAVDAELARAHDGLGRART